MWYIGNRWVSSTYQTELQGKGFTFVKETLSSYEYPTVNLSMTVGVVDAEMNGTDIHCTTSGNDGTIARSSSAFLWIVGMYMHVVGSMCCFARSPSSSECKSGSDQLEQHEALLDCSLHC